MRRHNPPAPAAAPPALAGAASGEALQPWPLAERPGFLIRRLHQIHVALFAEICAAHKVTPLQYSLLSALSECESADQTTLSNKVVLDRTTTTGALKRLEARGLVQRGKSPEDRRSHACRLTPQGRALHALMEQDARRAHAATLAPLDAADSRTLVALLKRIVDASQTRCDGQDLL
ncbi:MarR family winged helix-turn-helix transcriptional regulator [Azorhizobium doebereinerae]|uniref:MarR family winged helix-turn-helix transcriptional regulator n=1 Tax=Azorhizobium doebereinerae TaxID=281091 RepID=UPI0004144183|nr:MarR family transcriptional regulator [Azorhizobium doebereinerae]